jgi:hypothetical protein
MIDMAEDIRPAEVLERSAACQILLFAVVAMVTVTARASDGAVKKI